MDEVRVAVAASARRCVRAGLIAAFGHVSARAGEHVVITGTRPLADCRAIDTLVLDLDGRHLHGPAGDRPLEAAMHLAVYRARPDVAAICRGHPPALVRWGVGTAPVPLRHGLGAIAGPVVAVHPDPDLIAGADAGRAVARTLGDDLAVVLRANGALAVGATADEAATRLWFLEERAAVAAAAAPAEPVPEEVWARRQRHTPAELARATAWFTRTFDDPGPRPDDPAEHGAPHR